MVTSVQSVPFTPATAPANSNRAVSNDAAARSAATSQADRIDTAYRGDTTGSQTALDDATAKLDLALAAGRQAAGLLTQLRDAARSAIGGSDADKVSANANFTALLQRYGDVVNNAIDGGAGLLSGQSLTVALDPEAAPLTVQGYDLRLKSQPGAEDVLKLSAQTDLSDPAAVARDADASLARLDTALGRLSGASQRLGSHASFLSALDNAVADDVTPDLDAEGARLTALQVRQTLTGFNAAIANSAPSNLLTLFRD
jgi:flagellin